MLTTITALLISAFAADQSVIVPQDSTKFEVSSADLVRISEKAIAGSQVTFKVEGPAQIARINNLSERIKGKLPIGSTMKEAEIKPTGAGEVKVTVVIESPNGEPKATVYRFTVKD